MSQLHIRPASSAVDDGMRLLANFDSQLPWLATVGSDLQWGSEKRGTQAEQQEKMRGRVKQSETGWDEPFNPDWVRVYIAEAEVEREELVTEEQRELAYLVSSSDGDGGAKYRIPVAAMILAGESMEYVRSVLSRQDEGDPFMYLAYLLSDRRARPMGKGAGAALLRHAKDEAKVFGIRRICGDCWSGNEGRLVRYYESQGFKVIGELKIEEKQNWPCAVIEMRV